MSLDNVVALAAIARGNFWLLAIGVALSLPILGFGGMLLAELLRARRALVAFGAALLGWIAGGMAISDPVIAPWANANAPGLVAIAPALVAAFVWLNDLFAVKEAGPVTISEPLRTARRAARAAAAPSPHPSSSLNPQLAQPLEDSCDDRRGGHPRDRRGRVSRDGGLSRQLSDPGRAGRRSGCI